MKNKKFQMSIGVGGPSIMMIFVVLCLSTLGALAFVTANADWKLSTKTADAVQTYYAADGTAEELLAEADASLKRGERWNRDTHHIFVSDHQDFVLTIESGPEGVQVLQQMLEISAEWTYQDIDNTFDGRMADE